jgi:pimeloyl-ACP methyl ester carboxylesterase
MSGAGAVVLVHGGFVDGSGWEPVYRLLKERDYSVSVVQNPTLSLEGDVAAAKRVIDAQGEPVILVGHSYGGAVITEAGNDPNVAALVYIAEFAPDSGESVNTLIANPPPVRQCRRFCRHRTALYSSTGRSSTRRSQRT